MRTLTFAALALALAPVLTAAGAEIPDSIAAPGQNVVLRAHAEGAQVYECKTDAEGKLTWQFREPIATLMVDAKTVGRHYAGPTWEIGGSTVAGKVVAQTPGVSSKDIPWLKLDVADHRVDGPFRGVATVQRINTSGGNLAGACERAGSLRSEPYSADYVFLKH